MSPRRELIETIDNLPIAAITSAISRCPVFYGKDAKAVSFVNATRTELINFVKNQKSVGGHWTDAWREFTKQQGASRLKTLGRDIASRKERDMVRKSIERYLNEPSLLAEVAL